MPVTAIASFSLVAGSNESDPYEEAQATVEKRLQGMLQQDHSQVIYCGRQHERPDMLDVLITHEDIDDGKSRATSPGKRVFNKEFESILTEADYNSRAFLEPFFNLKSALGCPVTEVATFYFAGDPPADYLIIFHDFRAAAEDEERSGLLASAGGITHEEVMSEGTKSKAAVFVAGWRSMDAHKDFKNTNTYKEHMPRLMQCIDRVEAHHVSFQRLV